jgi:hypothetical protein
MYEVVDLEYPDKPDFHASPENLVVRYLHGQTSIEQLFVQREFHQIVVKRNQQIGQDVMFQGILVERNEELDFSAAFGEYL